MFSSARVFVLSRKSFLWQAVTLALKLAPEDFVARLNYGIALLNLNKFAEAEKQLRQALQKNAAAPTGHYYVALALMKQHEFEAASGIISFNLASGTNCRRSSGSCRMNSRRSE
jgi:tetratricopeptide (TPR) repeat protein